MELKESVDLLENLREAEGLDRDARLLYSVVLQARDFDNKLAYTSVSALLSITIPMHCEHETAGYTGCY